MLGPMSKTKVGLGPRPIICSGPARAYLRAFPEYISGPFIGPFKDSWYVHRGNLGEQQRKRAMACKASHSQRGGSRSGALEAGPQR